MRYSKAIAHQLNKASNLASRTFIRLLDLNYLVLRLLLKPNSRSGRLIKSILDSMRDTLRYTSSPLGARLYATPLLEEDASASEISSDNLSMRSLTSVTAVDEETQLLANSDTIQVGAGLAYAAISGEGSTATDGQIILRRRWAQLLRKIFAEELKDPQFTKSLGFRALAGSSLPYVLNPDLSEDDEEVLGDLFDVTEPSLNLDHPFYTPNHRLHLIHAYQRFTQGMNFSFKYLWPLGFLSLLSYDFYQLLMNSLNNEPDYGSTIGTLLLGTSESQDSLSSQLGTDLVLDYQSWLGLIAFFTAPITTGLLNWLRYSYIHLRMAADIDRLSAPSHSQPLITNLAHINPWHATRMELNRAQLNLLWNGRLTGDYRDELLTVITNLAVQGGMTGVKAIEVMSNLIYSENRHHFNQWPTANSQALNFLAELNRLATFRTRSDLLTYIKANKELSSLGKQSSTILNLIFTIPSLILLTAGTFTAVRLFELGFFKFKRLYEVLQNCHDDRIKTYVARLGDYTCSVCGDWDFVYLKDIYTPQGCLDNLLASKLPADKMVGKIRHRLSHYSDEIEHIDLSRTDWLRWSVEDWNDFWDSFEAMGITRLDKLDISQIDRTHASPEDKKIIRLNQFLQQVQVSQLHLNDVGLADYQVGLLFNESLAFQTHLQELTASNNKIEGNGGAILFDSLAHLPAIESVNVSGNQINDYARQALSYFINTTDASRLIFADNQLSAATLNELTDVIAASQMTYLDLSRNPILANGNVTAFIKQLPHSKLQTLKIPNTKLKDADLIPLAEALPSITNLTSIDISNNDKLSPEVLAYFMEHVANSTVTTLGIGQLHFTSEALSYISRSHYPRITTLVFSNNEVLEDDTGFTEFLNLLSNMPALINIDVSKNALIDDQVDQLAQVSNGKHKAMQAIRLTNNRIKTGSPALIDWLTRADLIDLGYNPLNATLIEKLAPALARSNTTTLIIDYAHIDRAALKPLIRRLPETRLKVFSPKGIQLSQTADALAISLVRNVPDLSAYKHRHLTLNQRRALNRGQPATDIRQLDLNHTALDDEEVRLLCRMFPSADISLGDFDLNDNPFDQHRINPITCASSPASRLQPFTYEALFDAPLARIMPTGQADSTTPFVTQSSGMTGRQYLLLAAASPAGIILGLIALYLLIRFMVNQIYHIAGCDDDFVSPGEMALTATGTHTETQTESSTQRAGSGYHLFGWFGQNNATTRAQTSQMAQATTLANAADSASAQQAESCESTNEFSSRRLY